MPNLTFEALREEYARLWATMEVRPSKAGDIDATAAKIVAKKNSRYKTVQSSTGVPWYIVGLIHAMEAGCDFSCHLHNGDSLAHRTVQVPKGRPVDGEPPYKWVDSAADAIRYDGLDKVTDWTIERICFELEKFNGTGYRRAHPEVLTPYLWSGTNHYSRGKYVKDGKWDASVVSGQSGAIPILKACMALDASIKPGVAEVADPEIEEKLPPDQAFPRTPPQTSTVRVAAQSRTFWAQIVSVFSVILGVLTNLLQNGWDWLMWFIGVVPSVADDVRPQLNAAQEVAGWFHLSWMNISLTVASVAIGVAIWRHIDLKRKVSQ